MAFPSFGDVPPDFHVLSDSAYRGKFILYGPRHPTESAVIYRMTTPSEEAAIEADRAAERAKFSVYFIQEGENGPIKIGTTNNVSKRLVSLQIGNAKSLHLLATVTGDAEDEKWVHAAFKHLRLRGEWFRPDEELLEFISEMKAVGGSE